MTDAGTGDKLIRRKYDTFNRRFYAADQRFTWTDERVHQLREMWNQGATASQIAHKLGNDFTRSAVMGKVRRLDLLRRTKINPQPKKKIIRTYRPKASVILQAPVPLQPEIIIPIEDVPLHQRKTLVDLGPDDCRWPIGDPCGDDFYFCGAETFLHHPYCGYHCRIAYVGSRALSDEEIAARRRISRQSFRNKRAA